MILSRAVLKKSNVDANKEITSLMETRDYLKQAVLC